MIDALERQFIATLDILGVFMQTDMDELIHIKLVGELADLLICVDPSYKQFVTYKNNTKIIHTELNKALYGTLQGALLFWKKLSGFLLELRFTTNLYNSCVMSKQINGKQAIIAWHVDNLKISHVDNDVLEDLISEISDEFGKEAPLTVTRGKIHNYLGMKIDFTKDGEVSFFMHDYINMLIKEKLDELLKGPSTTAATNHLFNANHKAKKHDAATSILYHHLVAKLSYLGKQIRPNLLTVISFLCTRVQSPDKDDWKNLGRCIRFLLYAKDEFLTLSATGTATICWWIDASFTFYDNLRSHTGATMSMDSGCLISISTKHKMNTRSSTEA